MGKAVVRRKGRERWVSTAIPRALADEVRKKLSDNPTYTGLTSFVADAVRRRLEEIEGQRPVEVPAE